MYYTIGVGALLILELKAVSFIFHVQCIYIHVHVPLSEMGSIFCRSACETAESMQSEMSGGQSPALDHAYHTHPPTCIVIHGG